MTDAEGLSERCRDTAELADAGAAWISDPRNRDRVGAEPSPLRRELRRAARRARKLSAAARRKLCVGVYGPSQAGKSYLIGVLARPSGGRLTTRFEGADRDYDFLGEINPEGQGESTGLVTRFTLDRGEGPAGFPVRLRFLSEADLARILINSFALDGDNSETPPQGDALEQALATAASRAGADADPAFPTEEMWDVQDYVASEFRALAYFQPFQDFWERAADLVPRLSREDRAELLAWLWGRHAPLTRIFLELSGDLAALGGGLEGHVGPDALTPRAQSIIDVQTLKELDGAAEFEPVEVRGARGASARLPRGRLAALVAELIVPLEAQPWDFLGGTDLLDFPGTRNRFKKELGEFLEKGEAPLHELFLRGKVAYLFDRYVAEQEMTSMLLCIGEGNMEATDLPALIDSWVARTHGASAEDRARMRCMLFVVLTKFDRLLADGGGSGTGEESGERFHRRVVNALSEPFGKMPDSWLNDWAGGAPFSNSFWLRDPGYEVPLLDRDQDGRETGVRAGREGRLEELRSGAVDAERVRRHFADPQAAWEAVMTPNDGGVTRLAEALAEICRPEVKAEQIAAQLDEQRRFLHQRLSQFHVSSDIEARLEEKRSAAEAVIDGLDRAFELNRFGELMEALTVDPSRIRDAIARTPANIHIVAAGEPGARDPGQPGRGEAETGRARPGRPRPGRARPGASATERAGAGPTAASAPASGAGAQAETPGGDGEMRRMTLDAFQTERALEVWSETLHGLLDRPGFATRFGLAEAAAGDLVGELEHASRRFGLAERLREAVTRWDFSAHPDMRADPVSVVAAEGINRFVARLGVDLLPEDERPVVETADGGTRPVFEPAPVRWRIDALPETQTLSAETRLVDWTFALYRMFEDNAVNVDDNAIDLESNLQLGEILAGLRP